MSRRKCGNCQLCCELLPVPPAPAETLADEKCKHQCSRGCAVYASRPNACRQFACVWLKGLLPQKHQPHRTGIVVWETQMRGTEGSLLQCIQANVHKDQRTWHKPTVDWLVKTVSHLYPVIIQHRNRNHVYSYGAKLAEWHKEDFVNFDFVGNRIVGATVVPREQVIVTDEDAARWAEIERNAITVRED